MPKANAPESTLFCTVPPIDWLFPYWLILISCRGTLSMDGPTYQTILVARLPKSQVNRAWKSARKE